MIKGDVVTFEYEKYSRYSVPINARIVRNRKDVSWEQVVKSDDSQRVGSFNGMMTTHYFLAN